MIGDIFQPTHLLFVLVVALLVLGPKRLPEVGRSLGRGIRDFRSALSGEEAPHREEVASPLRSEATTVPAAPVQTAPVPPAPAQTVPAPPEPAELS